MKIISKHRSLLKTWKIKKIIKKNGEIYFTIHYKSIFGFWRAFVESTGFMDEYDVIVRFDTLAKAKDEITKEIINNIRDLNNCVDKVIEIKFDKKVN